MAKIKDKTTGRFIAAQSNKDKFYEKINIPDDINLCWEWIAGKDKDGYGTLMLRTNKGQKRIRAHRYSWEIYFGKIPNKILVLHHCDNPSCVNPSHLFLGTHKDNTQDMIKKGRMGYTGHPGESHYKSKLTKNDVLKIRDLYNTKKFSQVKLGKMFSVSGHQIGMIVNRKNWSHI